MDFAIFDMSGLKPLMVIETKPLGTDLPAKAQQLARYISQLADLHFGIITDGCDYLFFGDLENPNQMDKKPFFSFSLDDMKTDWGAVAKFLTKFSRDTFNADTLITDAENSHYRQAMVDKLVNTLKNPSENEDFLKWLTSEMYRGKRTTIVMARLGEVAKQAIEPALMRLIGDDFLEKLKERMLEHRKSAEVNGALGEPSAKSTETEVAGDTDEKEMEKQKRGAVETTEEEIEFYKNVRDICVKMGSLPEDIIYRDTVNYFNVSFQRPSNWFVRYFGNRKRTNVVTRIPFTEAQQLLQGFDIEEAPAAFGISRVYIDSPAQAWAIEKVIRKSFEIAKTDKDDSSQDELSEG
jgi:hypothetical protein